MNNMKVVAFLSMLVFSQACTTTTYNIKSVVDLGSGEDQELLDVYQEISVPVSAGHRMACWLSSWIYGGWCWVYFIIDQTNEAKAVAKSKEDIASKLGSQAKITYQDINFSSWEWRISKFKSDRYRMKLIETGAQKSSPDDTQERGYSQLHPHNEGSALFDNKKPAETRVDSFKFEREAKYHLIEKMIHKKLLTKKRNELLSAGYNFEFGADIGTSHSDNGLGISMGVNFPSWKLEIGYGLISKGNVLGPPWSAGFYYKLDHLDENYVKFGLNHYTGQGVQEVRYDNTLRITHEVRWDLSYLHIGLGKNYHLERGHWYYEIGLASGVYSNIKPKLEGAQTNLRDPDGIIVDGSNDYFNRSGAGLSDGGVYLRGGIRI